MSKTPSSPPFEGPCERTSALLSGELCQCGPCVTKREARSMLDSARDAMAAAEAQLVSATNKACREERCYAEAKDCPKRAAILRMRDVVEKIDRFLMENAS